MRPIAVALMTPRGFFDIYVKPAVADCEAELKAMHRAVSALCHIDALAEEVWRAKREVSRSPRAYRTALKARQIELAYAWDVHDIHKHGTLTQRTPVLPNRRRPEVVQVGAVFQKNVFQQNVFQVGKPRVVLILQDGKQLDALAVIQTCVRWWYQELATL